MAYWTPDRDEIFGKYPEAGSLQDIAQSLLNKSYDPEGSLVNRILRETEYYPSTTYGQTEGEEKPDPVIRDIEKEEANKGTWKPKSNTYVAPDIMALPQYTVPRREVGRIGGEPNMYGRLQNDITEEEELAMLAQLLRRRA